MTAKFDIKFGAIFLVDWHEHVCGFECDQTSVLKVMKSIVGKSNCFVMVW